MAPRSKTKQGKTNTEPREPSAAEKRKQLLDAIMETYDGDTIDHRLFRRAVELEREKHELFKRIDSNRTNLRSLATDEMVSREDVDALYPPKQSKADESTAEEATAAEPEPDTNPEPVAA